ncbi:MAG: UPF0489 family protein [Prolixibacteraceae bacterium]|nr:UPF0489 family protein [Prolixibacteraceae bacterium]
MEQLVNKGFNYSGCYNLNILFRSNNFYVMDNHGAALWAWLQHIDKNRNYNFIHIDKHYDTLASNLSHWLSSLPKNLNELTISDYFSLKYKRGGEEFPIIRWDNYIPIFNGLCRDNILNYTFYTHGCGSTGIAALDQNITQDWPSISLFENLKFLLSDSEEKAILNLDIDYFFGCHHNKYFQLFSNESIEILFDQIQQSYFNTDKIEVLTVALSPECCGGWPNSVRIYNMLAKRLGIDLIKLK